MSALVLQAGDVHRLIIYTYMNGQLGMNTFHTICNTVDPGPPSMINIAQFWATLFPSKYVQVMANEATYLGLGLRHIDPLPIGSEAVSIVGTGPGVGGTPPLPSQTCGLITQVGGLPALARKGRTYLPFPPSAASVAPGVPSAGYLTGIQPIGNILINTWNMTGPYTGTQFNFICGWRPPQPTHTPPLLRSYAVPQFFVRAAKWATQRRRGGFGRPNALPF